MIWAPRRIETNLAATNATTRGGQSLAAGATPHTDIATFDTVIASLTAEAQGVAVRGSNIFTAGAATAGLLSLAVGAAASEVVKRKLLVGGGSDQHGWGAIFPLQVAQGARLSAMLRAEVASETMELIVAALEDCVNIEDVGAWVTYGADADGVGSSGVNVAPGTNAFGTPSEIGTTSEDHNLFHASVSLDSDTNVSARGDLLRIGTGPDLGSIMWMDAVWQFGVTSSESANGMFPYVPIYKEVPSGTKLWAAIASGGADGRDVIISAATGTVVAAGGAAAFDPLGQVQVAA